MKSNKTIVKDILVQNDQVFTFISLNAPDTIRVAPDYSATSLIHKIQKQGEYDGSWIYPWNWAME